MQTVLDILKKRRVVYKKLLFNMHTVLLDLSIFFFILACVSCNNFSFNNYFGFYILFSKGSRKEHI